MRKQTSTGSRTRRRVASPTRTNDPFHNGQTPACGELLNAIQDVFPELQPENQNNSTTTTASSSSELGKLLRWQFLENRKARRLPPPPLLESSSSPQEDDVTSSAKKKKKKKKKKKGGTNSSGSNGGGGGGGEEENKADGPPTAGGEEDQNTSNNNEVDGSDEKSLDQSLGQADLLVVMENPTLDSVPSEFSDMNDDNNSMHNSTYYFEQIQPQNQEEDLLSPTRFIKQIKPQSADILSAMAAPDLDGGLGGETKDEDAPGTPQKPITSSTGKTDGGLVTPSQSQSEINSNILDSPTHEWVPRDSAEPKEETPPGEAIKDPLTLPFLLTLSEDNSMPTTTTIDGSLILAAHAPDDEPNRLETTRILFEEWLEQLDHDQKENRRDDYKSFLDFLQNRLQSGGQPLGIPYQNLHDACSNILCYTCRQEATQELKKLNAKGPIMVLNPNCLREESRAKTDAAVESAFDYVALEEGHHNPQPKEEEEEEPDLDTCLSFVTSETKIKGNAPAVKPQLYLQSVTQKHLDTLAELWLPCGIEEDVMVTTVVQDEAAIILTNDELIATQQSVLKDEKDLRISLDEAHDVKSSVINELERANSFSGPETQSNVEFKVYPNLRTCDQMCLNHMDELFEIVKATSKEAGQELADLHFHLWTSYLGALDKSLKACHSYYTEMEKFADQRGVLPKMFISAELRGVYKTLVEEKVRAWTGLCDVLTKSWSGRMLKEYCTRSYWRNKRSESSDAEESPLDEDCNKLIKELADWTETSISGKMSEIMKVRITHTSTLLELLQAIVEPLTKEYETVERYFSADRNVYFANLRSQIVLVGGVKKRMRLMDEKEVQNMAMAVILMWRHTRIMQDRMITSKEKPSLPLQLKRWMLQDERGFDEWRHPSLTSTAITHHHMYCRSGVGGKRRVMCVLAGLAYEWLGQRCKEWKAEMAEKELLIDFMTDSTAFAGTNGENNKSAKKKKKKKKKAPTASQSILDDDIPKTLDSSPTDDDSKESVDEMNEEKDDLQPEQIESDSKDIQSDPRIESIATTKSEDKAVVEAKRDYSKKKEEPALTPIKPQKQNPVNGSSKNIPAKSKSKKTNTTHNFDDFPTSVYVQDDKKMISGKDFLIGRLNDLLKKNAGGKQQVVFVQQ